MSSGKWESCARERVSSVSYTHLDVYKRQVKVATNSALADHKANWIDYNAGQLLEGKTMDEVSKDFFRYILDVASGKKTRNEINGYREISIFKDGVVL